MLCEHTKINIHIAKAGSISDIEGGFFDPSGIADAYNKLEQVEVRTGTENTSLRLRRSLWGG